MTRTIIVSMLRYQAQTGICSPSSQSEGTSSQFFLGTEDLFTYEHSETVNRKHLYFITEIL